MYIYILKLTTILQKQEKKNNNIIAYNHNTFSEQRSSQRYFEYMQIFNFEI